jgi:hypothetical protein
MARQGERVGEPANGRNGDRAKARGAKNTRGAQRMDRIYRNDVIRARVP